MPEFNLIDEPWIPCIQTSGTQVELGLLETLGKAHTIRQLLDPSPLITLALHRLLLAILHRNFGPSNLACWQELWKLGRWDKSVLSQYLQKWHDRFFLFDQKSPFYQYPGELETKEHPICHIAMELASGNNATLFDHHYEGLEESWEFSKAVRYLVAYQAYAVAGGVSKPFNFFDGPLTRGEAILLTGNTLFQTLALNLLPYNDQSPLPSLNLDQDLPTWERETPHLPDKNGTRPDGYVDYLTWQCRRVKLLKNSRGGCSEVQILQNLRLPTDVLDPMKAYRPHPKIGWVPIRFDPDRASWRDSHTLFRFSGKESRRPLAFELLSNLREEDLIQPLSIPALGLSLVGMGFGESIAKIILWRYESLPFHIDYVSQPQLLDALRKGIQLAENVGSLFRIGKIGTKYPRPFRVLAENLLIPQEERRDAKQKAQQKDMDAIVNSLAPDRIYWSKTEVPYTAFFSALMGDIVEDNGQKIYGNVTLPDWIEKLKKIARKAFEESTRSLDTSARVLKALELARLEFNMQLAYVSKLGTQEGENEDQTNEEETV